MEKVAKTGNIFVLSALVTSAVLATLKSCVTELFHYNSPKKIAMFFIPSLVTKYRQSR